MYRVVLMLVLLLFCVVSVMQGIALCYNRSRFKLLQHQSVRFSDHIPPTSNPELSKHNRSVTVRRLYLLANSSGYYKRVAAGLMMHPRQQVAVNQQTHNCYSGC